MYSTARELGTSGRNVQRERRHGATNVHVKAATRELRGSRDLPIQPRAGLAGQDFTAQVREESSSPHFQVELATDGQDRIADGFCFQAAQALAPQQIIVG